jgi:hypothetical protein
VPAKKKPEASKGQFHVGDHVAVNLHAGKIVEARIMAVVPKGNSIRLQVDYEKDRTALVYEWQVVEKLG